VIVMPLTRVDPRPPITSCRRARAGEEGAQLVVLEIDTPAGPLMREIIKASSPPRAGGLRQPGGAAASAGRTSLCESHAAMAPGTNSVRQRRWRSRSRHDALVTGREPGADSGDVKPAPDDDAMMAKRVHDAAACAGSRARAQRRGGARRARA
jgi:membrane-bound ClpP family serine protease